MEQLEKLEDLKTVEEAVRYIGSSVSQWRARKRGDLDFYRLNGKIVYTDQMLKNYIEKQRCKEFAFLKAAA